MKLVPKQIKETLNATKEIFKLIVEIAQLIRKNRLLFFTIIGLLVSYFGGKFVLEHYAINKPKKVISQFYDYLNNDNYEKAWKLLNEDFKHQEWDNDIDKFKKGYGTYGKYSKLSLSNRDNLKNLFTALFYKERNYDVTLEKKEIVKISEFKKENSWHKFRNSLWIQLQHNDRLNQIITNNPSNTIDFNKFYLIKSKVLKINNKWEITELEKAREGLVY